MKILNQGPSLIEEMFDFVIKNMESDNFEKVVGVFVKSTVKKNE